MLSAVLFALSRSRRAEAIATHAPGFRGFSRRFVAGTTQAEALAAVARLNDDGFVATVSFLGEAVSDAPTVRAAVDEFTSFAAAVGAPAGPGGGPLRCTISVKLTQLGLAFDRALTERSLDEVLSRASTAGVFVRVDMEDSRYTQATLDIVRAARTGHAGVGIVLQAALRRSAGDIAALAAEGAPVRLVKGAYREPAAVAFAAKRDVDAAYVRLVDSWFAGVSRRGDPGRRSARSPAADEREPPAVAPVPVPPLAIATHDARVIRAALQSARRHDVERDAFEFQMLYGIRTDLQRKLRDRGHPVRVYVPYGSHWYPYLMRRLAERPANLWFFLRGALRR
ncbi:MAG: proline dehydrogenase family protein [Dehalococcoidia bacterium]|nr:proline dehydrogenase family protein [Dehalococcoidia bacterium]